jgi:hypothetical protein
MRIYTTLTDSQIERLLRSVPVSREQVTTVYSDDGIFEIKHKIHKVCIQDAPCETRLLRGRECRLDPSVRTLQERWQIPLPHDADIVTVSTYDVAPGVRLVFEQNCSTRYYFVADTCDVVVDWLDTLPL